MNFKLNIILILAASLVYGCKNTQQKYADLIIYNGVIYTADSANNKVNALAVKGHKIMAIGYDKDILNYKNDSTKVIDLQGKTMTPGWIEGHGHLMNFGNSELNLNLLDVKSYDELVEKVAEAVKKAKPGEWILGRGWHQSKWNTENEIMIKGFQTHLKLSAVSPHNPVYLKHASGHAGFANQKAMEIAGVLPMAMESLVALEVEGGEVIKDDLGNPTGIFNERAMDLIQRKIPVNNPDRNKKALELAIAACWRNGITGFHDAGVDQKSIDLYKQFKADNKLGIRLYVMLDGRNPDLLEQWFATGPLIDTTGNLTVRSVKLRSDGALGSRGAWLIAPYSDMPNNYGHQTFPVAYNLEQTDKAVENGFQVGIHAIGDRANREVLNIYEEVIGAHPELNDLRLRIEHAQHLHPDDIPRFGALGVIPAMQAIHMASDRPWAIDRLGEQRIRDGAYVWRSLIDSGAVIVNGSDVPVEPIHPLASFYASVSRKTLEGTPEDGYEPEQKMTREEALKSYTINAAYGAFQEQIIGSIAEGKIADFTVFDKDIMSIEASEILNTKVVMTIFGGEVVYEQQ